jgi:excisionase family DNA binding protein
MKQNYLSVKDVSELYGVEETTVRDWANNKELVAEKIGKQWFFPKDQFEPKSKIVCSYCGAEITGYDSEEDYLEARISGFCQDCINKAFGEQV